ncbi:MAG: hypothetical protein ACF8TS_14795 [Maioricimonas sp. JB049]
MRNTFDKGVLMNNERDTEGHGESSSRRSMQVTPEQLAEAVTGELEAFFDTDDPSIIGPAVIGALEDVVTFNDSMVDSPYETLYVDLKVGKKSSAFRHMPSPAGLWCLLRGVASPDDEVELTVVSRNGTRTVKNIWPFTLETAEFMTRPAAPRSSDLPPGGYQDEKAVNVGPVKLYFSVQTGPPTWWFPKARFQRLTKGFAVQAGWIRGLVSFGIMKRIR